MQVRAADAASLDPQKDFVEPRDRTLMDRWALSELQLTVKTVTDRLDAYDVTGRRLWRFYLAYCEAGFATGRTDVIQVALRPA